jgi:hypothetical protein
MSRVFGVVWAPSLVLADRHVWRCMLVGWSTVWLHPTVTMELSMSGIWGHSRFASCLGIFFF